MKETALENQAEDLARITKKGFDEIRTEMRKGFGAVGERFEAVDERFDAVDDSLSHVHARLDTLERDVSEIKKHFVYRDEFEELDVRVDTVEERLGMKQR